MNLLLGSIRIFLIFDLFNHVIAQTFELVDCDCSPTQYTFDVFFDRDCNTQSLSGIDRNAIFEPGITCEADQVNLMGTGGSYGYNATISNLGPLPARSFIISGELLFVGDNSFQISFPGQFGSNGAPVAKENYSAGLQIELNVFTPTDILNPLGTMKFFIPYTGTCDQEVFSDGDSIAWITYNGADSSGPLDQTCTSSRAPSEAPSRAPTILSSICSDKGKGKGNLGCKSSKSTKSAKSYKVTKSMKSAKSYKVTKSVKSEKSYKVTKSMKSAKSYKVTKSMKSATNIKTSPKSTKILSAKGKGARRFVSPNKKKHS